MASQKENITKEKCKWRKTALNEWYNIMRKSDYIWQIQFQWYGMFSRMPYENITIDYLNRKVLVRNTDIEQKVTKEITYDIEDAEFNELLKVSEISKLREFEEKTEEEKSECGFRDEGYVVYSYFTNDDPHRTDGTLKIIYKDSPFEEILKQAYSIIKANYNRSYVIRELRKNETDLLKDFLYEAIFIPKGVEPPARNIVEKPELRVYTDNFGTRKGDNCLVADFEGKVVGAVWTRIMDDYGHVDDETPSFAISLFKEYRGQGIGTQLMVRMLELLKQQGYKKASLAVQKANYAVRMYENVGFKTVDENDEEYIMVCELQDKLYGFG